MEKKKKEEQSKNLDEVKKEMLIQTTDQWIKNQQLEEKLTKRHIALNYGLPQLIGELEKNDCFSKSPELGFKQQPQHFIPLEQIIGQSFNQNKVDNDFTLQNFINDVPANMN